MKKIFCLIGILILLFCESLSVVAASGTEDDAVSLSALFGMNKINCDKIEFSLFGRRENYEIDKEKFWNLADEIRLKRINNILVSSENSFIISAFSGEEVHTVTMWDKCRVGSEKTRMYSAPTGDYIMKASDYEKLVGLFPMEAKPNLPKIKGIYANFVYWAMDHPTWMYLICAVMIIVFIGTVGFVVGYNIRKKKRTDSR